MMISAGTAEIFIRFSDILIFSGRVCFGQNFGYQGMLKWL